MSIEGRVGVSSFGAAMSDAIGLHIDGASGNFTVEGISTTRFVSTVTVRVFGELRNFAPVEGSILDEAKGAMVQLQLRESLAAVVDVPLESVIVPSVASVSVRRRQLQNADSWVEIQFEVVCDIWVGCFANLLCLICQVEHLVLAEKC